MNYEKIYNQIIERGKSRKLNSYKENHHVIPRCMGGTDESENIVELTAKEHFICHKLLTEMYPTENGLHYGALMMSRLKNTNGRCYRVGASEYQRLKENVVVSSDTREKMSKGQIGRKHTDATKRKISKSNSKPKSKEHRKNIRIANQNRSPETRSKISKAQRGKTISDKTRERMCIAQQNRPDVSDKTRKKMSESQKGKKLSDETKEKISKSCKNPDTEKRAKISKAHLGIPLSEEHKRKISESLEGKIRTEEHCKNLSKSQLGKKQQLATCPHCGKIGGGSSMKPYHFDNCKHKK